MKFGRNLASGLGSSAFSAVVSLAVVPFYLKYLGVEAYGLIGFFVTTQALLQLLDMGLSQTLNREMSRFSVDAKWSEARNLLHTLAIIYWSVALSIAALIFLFSNFLAGHWIKSDSLSHEVVQHSVQLIGIAIACRWPVGLYQGALNGLQLITVTSGTAVVMTALSGGGAVLLLALVSPSIETFFAWQACVGITHALSLRWFAWRAFPLGGKTRFDVAELRRIWKFATSLAAIALSAIILTQLDKVILSKILSLKDFGYYMLATAISSGLYLLTLPLFNVIYPRFSILVATGNEVELVQLYRVGTRLFATALFPIAFVVAAFAREIVSIWTGNELLAGKVAPLLSVLSIGTALHGVMYFPYALQLAYGVPRLALKINLMLLVALVPMTSFLAYHFGAIGGAAAWLILHSGYVLLGTFVTHRRLLSGIGAQWLIQDVARPLVVAILVVSTVRFLVVWSDSSDALALVFAAGAVAIAMVIGLLTSPQAYKLVTGHIRAGRVMT